MICKKCGHALPNNSIVCRNCGAMMEQEQIDYMNEMNQDKNNQKIGLLSEKYGQQNNIEYREEKENKALGIAVIAIILIFLIVITIIINVIK